ncbi:sugar transporter [Favolaschia claudopus]|uniref:Sugar transporter n=1 Tax=Favolaschia claudopus TaxID=2862362 RepID=A0AAW0B1C5_9AGAR
MRTNTLFALLGAGVSMAAPIMNKRVTLDAAATAEAQVRDDTATRAFSNTAIKTSDGQCLSVTSGTGDFRENLVPVKIAKCDGSAGQKWDVITKGKHNDQAGTALFVSSLIQGCLNFDPRRQPGNQVLLFSCGGRADGEGKVTNSQLFTFDGKSNTIPLAPTNQAGTCLFSNNGQLDQQGCSGNAAQLFTIGDGAAAPAPPVDAPAPPADAPAPPASAPAPPANNGALPNGEKLTKLDAAATAEAQVRDDTATRAFSNAAIKTADGQCLSVISGTGDFRENLVPVNISPCDGSAGQKFDVITKGKHNDQAGTALIVSSLIQGCLNFDPRRQPGNQVLLFSCGGRADGEGAVTNSQLFTFDGKSTSTPLAPTNQAGTCLFNNNGQLDQQGCSNGANQLFTISA